jgi:hypothetical protein
MINRRFGSDILKGSHDNDIGIVQSFDAANALDYHGEMTASLLLTPTDHTQHSTSGVSLYQKKRLTSASYS